MALQIPTFTLDDVTSLRAALEVALRIVDPHADALAVSIGATDGEGGYLGVVRRNGGDPIYWEG